MRLFLFVALLFGPAAWAQDEFRASTLPAALRENAHAVIRRHETTFTVRSAGEASQRVRTVVTILDEEGNDYASKVVGYDKLNRLNDLEGTLYDASGTVVKKLRKADIDDYSTYQDYNFYDDQRYKAARFAKQPAYPYTVEFSEETTSRNLMFYPAWMPQDDEYIALEQASLTVVMPPGMALRYKEMNMPPQAQPTPSGVVSLAAGEHTYRWQIANRPAVVFEPLSPPATGQLPVVYTAPAEFEVQGYRGKLTSWADLGRFYHSLNTSRDQLPDALRQQLIALTATQKTIAGKVSRVYDYLQQHTRYVSIQLGIGGWQTIEAGRVAASQYGDCKALTNYAGALLKAVGVAAYPALVRAGSDAVTHQTDFPIFAFNHVILCVPDGRDTTFLECTSSTSPAGYLGQFTGNRPALLITPDGGRLIRTPAYHPTDNRQQRRINLILSADGNATADIRTYYTGLQQDDYREPIHSLTRDEQRSWLLKRIRIPTFDLTQFALSQQPGRIPKVTETMSLAVRRWATPSGARLFLPLNVLSVLGPAPAQTKPRQAPLDLGEAYSYDDSDTISYQLPAGYTPEYALEPVAIDTKFGQYRAQATVAGDRLTYIRHVQMRSGRYPASAWAEWVDFRKKIARADRAQMVLVKKE